MSLLLRMHRKTVVTSGGKLNKEEKCLVPLDVRIGPQKKMGQFLYNTVMEDAMM